MTIRVEKVTRTTIIYEYAERKQAAKDANILKTLHGNKIVDFQLATPEEKGFYVVQVDSKHVQDLDRVHESI